MRMKSKMGPIDVASIEPPKIASLAPIIPSTAVEAIYDHVGHMRVLATLLSLASGDESVEVLDEVTLAADRRRIEIFAELAAIEPTKPIGEREAWL